ncbi:MAG: hypothetical protein WA888_01225 [Burkholderiaceae bacterium]
MNYKLLPGALAAAWGLGGVLTLLLFAVTRMARTSFDALDMPLHAVHWLVLAANIVFMAYAEGYRGFQQSYSPRVVARARYLVNHWTVWRLIAAPLFCMGFFHATRRRLITAWVLTAAIVLMVFLFAQLPQPWRGVLDAGIVVGLGWGIISIGLYIGRWLSGRQFDASPEVPVVVRAA